MPRTIQKVCCELCEMVAILMSIWLCEIFVVVNVVKNGRETNSNQNVVVSVTIYTVS